VSLQINQILQTKDGRIIGNAIITSVEPLTIITDYGNTLVGTTSEEVHELWYLPDMSEWYDIDTHRNYTKV